MSKKIAKTFRIDEEIVLQMQEYGEKHGLKQIAILQRALRMFLKDEVSTQLAELQILIKKIRSNNGTN